MKTVHHMVSGLVVAGVLLSGGCVKLWQRNLDIKTYMVEVQRPAAPLDSPLARKLWIDHVTVLPPFNLRNLVLRENDVEYTTSYYTELIIPPSENVRNLFFAWFSAGGVFEEVVIADRDSLSHRLVATVTELYGDLTTREAVLSIRVSLLDESAKVRRVLLSGDYVQRIGLEEINAEELIRAYNTAMAEILAECEEDVVGVLKKTRSADRV